MVGKYPPEIGHLLLHLSIALHSHSDNRAQVVAEARIRAGEMVLHLLRLQI